MGAHQKGSRLSQSPPAPQWRRDRHYVGLNYNERRVIYINIYLSSLPILVIAAAMSISPLVQVREIPDEASLSVLGHSGEGVVAACEEDRAAQVDGTGLTTIICY